MLTRSLGLLAATVLALGVQAATFRVDAAKQRYPWNGKVDIDYTVAYAAGEAELDPQANRLEAVATDLAANPAQTVRLAAFGTLPLPLSAGAHRVTWDAWKDGVTSVSDKIKVELVLVQTPTAPKFLVVDLTSGTRSPRLSVTFLDAEPAGGFNTDEYKTDKLVLRLVMPGGFMMGSPVDEPGRVAGTENQHPVLLTKPYYLGLFELTRGQAARIAGQLGQHAEHNGQGEAMPFAQVQAKWLRGGSAKDTAEPSELSILGLLRTKTGLAFDLPTEAQWEYAARAGTTTPYSDGVACASVADYGARMADLGRTSANWDDPRGVFYYPADDSRATRACPVGCYAPNAWGFHDMHGNVWELTRDSYISVLAGLGLARDPVCTTGSDQVAKGGGYSSAPDRCRSAARTNVSTTIDYNYLGCRLALTLD